MHALLEAKFRDFMTDEQKAAYEDGLRDLGAGSAFFAIRRLAEVQDRLPSIAQIRAAVVAVERRDPGPTPERLLDHSRASAREYDPADVEKAERLSKILPRAEGEGELHYIRRLALSCGWVAPDETDKKNIDEMLSRVNAGRVWR